MVQHKYLTSGTSTQKYTILSLAKKVCTFLAERSKTVVLRTDIFSYLSGSHLKCAGQVAILPFETMSSWLPAEVNNLVHDDRTKLF
jgi:hypothetical protein